MKPLCENFQTIDINIQLESLVYVRYTEVEICDSLVHCEKLFKETALKDMYHN